MTTRRHRHLPIAFSLAFLVPFARAATLQFDAAHVASVTTGAFDIVSEWRSRDGSVALVPLHGASNGWSHATLRSFSARSRSLHFADGGSASPLHADTPDFAVAHVFAVIRCEAPADLSTLLDAPCSARFLSAAWDRPALWEFAVSQLETTAEYAVNGVTTNVFTEAAGFQLVEASWIEAVPLSALYIGGVAASPLWRRAWAGEIAELVLLDRSPTSGEREALRRFAALKWGVPVSATDADAATLLRGLGVHTDGLFASVVKLR